MNRLVTVLVMALSFFGCIGKYNSEAQKVDISEKYLDTVEINGDTTKINLDKSKIFWKGTKMHGAGKHEGEIQLKSGYFITENNLLLGGKFIADMESIGVTDIPEHDTVPIKNLNGHLKSSDFFDVENHVSSTFEITNIVELQSDSLRISGNLTMKGITNNITIEAFKKDKKFSSKFTFDRFNWNIAFKGNWFDKTFVDKEIELTIQLMME